MRKHGQAIAAIKEGTPEPEANHTRAAERNGPGQGRTVGRPKHPVLLFRASLGANNLSGTAASKQGRTLRPKRRQNAWERSGTLLCRLRMRPAFGNYMAEQSDQACGDAGCPFTVRLSN